MRDFFTTKQVALALGVSEASLKRWCDKGIILANRTAGGHRRIPLGGVFQFLRQQRQTLVNPELLDLPAATIARVGDLAKTQQFVVHALARGEEDLFRASIFNLYLSGSNACDLFDGILAPAFRILGEKWYAREIQVYQERRACQICLNWLAELRLNLLPVAPDAPLAIGAAPEGDPYQLPTAMLEIVMREAGWRAQSYGSNLPFQTLCDCVRTLRPRLFWLSVSHIVEPSRFLEDYSRLFDAAASSGTALAVGGQALTAEIRCQMRCSAYGEQFRHLLDYAATLHPNPSAPGTTS